MTNNDGSAKSSESDEESFVNVTVDIDEEAAATTKELPDARPLVLSVRPHHDLIGVSSRKFMTHVCATIKAASLPDDESNRAPVDIVIALDVSSSMSGEKLALCKKTLELFLRQLLPQDRFGLVTFAGDATIVIPIMVVTEKNKETALGKIKSLKASGMTNISAAIGMSTQELGTIENPNSVRSIFLLTDGHANRGISSASGIVDIACACISKPKEDGTPPITIHCFGYGSSHNSKLLTDISETTSGGTYYFLDKEESNVMTAFGDALGGILSIVAQNVVVNLSVPPEASSLGVVITQVHHENVIERVDGSFSVPVGDFYAEESRDIIFDVKLATPGSEAKIPHASVSLSYLDTLNKCLVSNKPVVCSITRPAGEEVSKEDPHVSAQWLRVHCTKEMDEANTMCAVRGNIEGAREKMQQCRKLVAERRSTDTHLQADPLVHQLADDLDSITSGFSCFEDYDSFGSHTLQQASQSHRMQRCSATSLDSSSVYRGTNKLNMAKKFNTK